jgi:hypothetical protein
MAGTNREINSRRNKDQNGIHGRKSWVLAMFRLLKTGLFNLIEPL